MRHIFAKRLPVAILFFTAITTQAQNSNRENSPYSRFGIGELRNGANVMLRGMGTATTAYTNPANVNTDNPASYASLKLTTYEAGAEGNRKTISSATGKYTTGMATLSYMTVGIPIGKNAGMALGLRPLSRVYYNMVDTTYVDSFGTAEKKYFGDGSLNEGYVGFAGKYKGLSLGFNFGYIFGTISNESVLVPVDPVNDKVLGAAFQSQTRFGAIHWKAGAMYEDNLNSILSLRGGVTFSASQALNATQNEYWTAFRLQTDTIYSSPQVRGKVMLPMQYTAGIMLYSGVRWAVGIDYAGADWSVYRSFGSRDSLADNTNKFSVGAEYTPDASDTRKYFRRVTYRLGAYYGSDPVMLRGTQLDYYAVTAGFTLPFKKNVGRIHTSLEVGSRGTRTNGLLRESFVRFGLGFSFNDKWFIKRKYE